MRRLILTRGPELRRRILLITLAGIPILFLRSVNDPINVPKLALLFVGVSLAAAVKVIELLQGASVASLKRAWLPAVSIVLPLALAWAISPYRGWALFGLYDRFQGLLPYLAVAVIAVLIADSFEGKLEQLAWGLAISAAIVGAYGLVQVVGLDPIDWARADEAASDAGSTIGNPNFTGGFLAMALPLIGGLWLARPGKRRIISVLAAFALVGWIVTFSQGAWAAGIAGSLLALGVFYATRLPWARRAATAVAFLIALAVVGQVVLGVVRGGGPLVPGTVLLRAEAWKGAVTMAAESPFLGRGPNAYAVEGAHHRTQEDALRIGYDYPNDPHSVFMAMLTSAGVLGALGFLALLAWIFRRGARVRDGDLWGGVVLGSIAAYLVQSLVSIDELSLRSTFWGLIGALAAVTAVENDDAQTSDAGAKARKTKARRTEPVRYPIAVGAIALVALTLVWQSGRFLMADAYALRGVVHALKGEVGDARSNFDRAIERRNEFEYRRLYGLRIGEAALSDPENGPTVVEPVREAFGFLDGFPNVSMLVERARMLQATAVFDQELLEDSLATWERARRLDPLNPLIAVEMSSVLFQLERIDDARQVLEAYADDVGDRFPQFWGALALARAQTQDEAGAVDALERGSALDPEDPWVREAASFIEGGES